MTDDKYSELKEQIDNAIEYLLEKMDNEPQEWLSYSASLDSEDLTDIAKYVNIVLRIAIKHGNDEERMDIMDVIRDAISDIIRYNSQTPSSVVQWLSTILETTETTNESKSLRHSQKDSRTYRCNATRNYRCFRCIRQTRNRRLLLLRNRNHRGSSA